jgi:hypothetical protein
LRIETCRECSGKGDRSLANLYHIESVHAEVRERFRSKLLRAFNSGLDDRAAAFA